MGTRTVHNSPWLQTRLLRFAWKRAVSHVIHLCKSYLNTEHMWQAHVRNTGVCECVFVFFCSISVTSWPTSPRGNHRIRKAQPVDGEHRTKEHDPEFKFDLLADSQSCWCCGVCYLDGGALAKRCCYQTGLMRMLLDTIVRGRAGWSDAECFGAVK